MNLFLSSTLPFQQFSGLYFNRIGAPQSGDLRPRENLAVRQFNQIFRNVPNLFFARHPAAIVKALQIYGRAESAKGFFAGIVGIFVKI